MKTLVSEAEKLDKDDYKEDAWKTLQDEIAKAKDLYKEATKEQIAEQIKTLRAAMDDVKEPDKPTDPDPQPPIPPTDDGNGSGNGNGSGAGGSHGAAKTGDTAPIALWGALFAAAAAGIGGIFVKRRRKDR